MATNPPPGPGRVGAVKKRSQVYNPRTKRWTKIDESKGKGHYFIDQMEKKKIPFKGVKRENYKKKK